MSARDYRCPTCGGRLDWALPDMLHCRSCGDEWPAENMGPEDVKKSRCVKCGRVVWWRKVATGGQLSSAPGEPWFAWCSRRGSKPAPIRCPVNVDARGRREDYHVAEGRKAGYGEGRKAR